MQPCLNYFDTSTCAGKLKLLIHACAMGLRSMNSVRKAEHKNCIFQPVHIHCGIILLHVLPMLVSVCTSFKINFFSLLIYSDCITLRLFSIQMYMSALCKKKNVKQKHLIPAKRLLHWNSVAFVSSLVTHQHVHNLLLCAERSLDQGICHISFQRAPSILSILPNRNKIKPLRLCYKKKSCVHVYQTYPFYYR